MAAGYHLTSTAMELGAGSEQLTYDMGPNSTGGVTSNDTEGNVLFTLAGKDHCMRTSATAIWRGRKLEFNAFKWGPVVVRRYLDGNQLVWEYADGSVTRMNRICQLPPEHKTPAPREKKSEFSDPKTRARATIRAALPSTSPSPFHGDSGGAVSRLGPGRRLWLAHNANKSSHCRLAPVAQTRPCGGSIRSPHL